MTIHHCSDTERRRAVTSRAATLIQKMVRGHLTMGKGRVYMCEQMLERALTRRDEALINRAIHLPKLLGGVTSPLIKLYLGNAKRMVLELLGEVYVAKEIEEAMQIGSVDLLRSAILKAEQAHMPYLKELQQGRRALSQLLMLRSVVTSIEE